jgi:hypothetical protein
MPYGAVTREVVDEAEVVVVGGWVGGSVQQLALLERMRHQAELKACAYLYTRPARRAHHLWAWRAWHQTGSCHTLLAAGMLSSSSKA